MAKMNRYPLVSVIIVNFNGKDYVSSCIREILINFYPDFEIIVMDNGSTDGSVQYLRSNFDDKRLRIIELDKNYGPSFARNEGVKKSSGKYISFLDNDTKPRADWLYEPVSIMESDPSIGICQCKLLLMDFPDRIDYVGDYLGQYGFLVQAAEGGAKDVGQFDKSIKIFSAKSAGMVIRREAFEEAGGFDATYFIYVEETDLAWRVWLAGYRVVFSPDSVVLHKFGTSERILGKKQKYFLKYHGCKNYLTTLYKNLERRALVRIFPVHLFLWCGIAGILIIRGSVRDAIYILKGIFYFLYNIKTISQKRRQIQRKRKISDKVLFPIIMKRRPFSYFCNKLGAAGIGKGKGWA